MGCAQKWEGVNPQTVITNYVNVQSNIYRKDPIHKRNYCYAIISAWSRTVRCMMDATMA